jgi:hypothetical protein
MVVSHLVQRKNLTFAITDSKKRRDEEATLFAARVDGVVRLHVLIHRAARHYLPTPAIRVLALRTFGITGPAG